MINNSGSTCEGEGEESEHGRNSEEVETRFTLQRQVDSWQQRVMLALEDPPPLMRD